MTATAIIAMRGRKKIDGKPPRKPGKRTGKITSSSGACEWLLMQYEEIDRKFPIVDDDGDKDQVNTPPRRRKTA